MIAPELTLLRVQTIQITIQTTKIVSGLSLQQVERLSWSLINSMSNGPAPVRLRITCLLEGSRSIPKYGCVAPLFLTTSLLSLLLVTLWWSSSTLMAQEENLDSKSELLPQGNQYVTFL